jgi:hypothetical protein
MSAAGGWLPGSAVAQLEMHGTGTALGDPIEVGAALAVLRPAGAGALRRSCSSESAAVDVTPGTPGLLHAKGCCPLPQGGSQDCARCLPALPPPLLLTALKADAGHAEPAAGGHMAGRAGRLLLPVLSTCRAALL